MRKYYLYIVLASIVVLIGYLIYRQFDKRQHKLSLKANKIEVFKHYYNLDPQNPIIDSLEYGSIKRFFYSDHVKIKSVVDQINNAEWIREIHAEKTPFPIYVIVLNDSIRISFINNKVFRIYKYFEYELEDSLKLP